MNSEYTVNITTQAFKQLLSLSKSDPKSYESAMRIIDELATTPRSGIGKPKMLKGNLKGCWSRRITHKHRLVYTIDDGKLYVDVIQASGHYGDK